MEKSPKLSNKKFLALLQKWDNLPEELKELSRKVNDAYLYWDKVKYETTPEGYSPEDLWAVASLERRNNAVLAWKKYDIHFGLTSQMQQLCHELDMYFGGNWGVGAKIDRAKSEWYLQTSLMEESISSSQMEGASTTRKVAKEMLQKKISPKDKSQQMIYNNYQTIQFIVANKESSLTSDLLLYIHRLMTEKTLENSEDAGRLRQSDDVVVNNEITGEVVHNPPSYSELPDFVSELCQFFNEEKSQPFIHPILRAIIIHFMVAYMHPFVDGNGRTARALFYWYLLKQGYWLTEYLSISRIIYRSKNSYEKAFLYSEIDNNDIGYFIQYHLKTLEKAFKDLQSYIKRKVAEQQAATTYLRIGNINERQAEIMRMYDEEPQRMLTIKDLEVRFSVAATTAKSDMVGLIQLGAVREIALNKVKKGYVKGDCFDSLVK